ncbi:MAG: hypothetical protein AAFP70_13950 [Calditrichota bacterium]
MMLARKHNLNAGLTLVLLILFSMTGISQHRGDNLRFQGLDLVNRNGVKAVAMGGAFTAVNGELDALYWNPAGLVGLDKLSINANFNSNENKWRESQDYRPNRQLVTMSFILDGLYTPNPEFNGFIDNEAFFEDSTYIVNDPLLGADSYSEEAADWQKALDNAGLTNLSAAYPIQLGERKLVASAGYNANIGVNDYDRNITHLTPHPAFDGYGDLPSRVVSAQDSVFINWSDFERQRVGDLRSYHGALAFGWNENIRFGLSFESVSGKTDEFQSLNRIGVFELVDGIQIFRFNYDTLDVRLDGTSDFSATKFNLGTSVSFGKLTVGANLRPGYTIKREWNYTTTVATADSMSTGSISGEDNLEIPFSFTFGLGLAPTSKFQIAMDIEHNPYADANFVLAQDDATLRNWVDQTTYRVGVEFKPIEAISLMGGYRNVPQVFSPDGAADDEKGPEANIFTLGASAKVAFAQLNAAYEFGSLKYYDTYFSNTNFAYQQSSSLLVGLTLSY